MINAGSRGFPLEISFTKKYYHPGRHNDIILKSSIKLFPERCNFLLFNEFLNY